MTLNSTVPKHTVLPKEHSEIMPADVMEGLRPFPRLARGVFRKCRVSRRLKAIPACGCKNR